MTQMFIVLLAIEREIVNLTFEGKQTLEEFATILLNLFLVEYESNFLLFNILAAFTQIKKLKIPFLKEHPKIVISFVFISVNFSGAASCRCQAKCVKSVKLSCRLLQYKDDNFPSRGS